MCDQLLFDLRCLVQVQVLVVCFEMLEKKDQLATIELIIPLAR